MKSLIGRIMASLFHRHHWTTVGVEPPRAPGPYGLPPILRQRCTDPDCKIQRSIWG